MIAKPISERLATKYVIDGECWVFTGSTGTHGYGQMSLTLPGGRQTVSLAHRLAYEAWVGPIPGGMQIDHLCRRRLCINPEHLEAVTQRTNILRSDAPSAVAWRTNTCGRGHDLASALITREGHRYCRICRRIRDAAKSSKESA